MSLKSSHPTFNELADLAEGRIAAHERQALSAHLAGCRACSDKLSRLERAVELMRTDVMTDAPSHLIERASKLLRPQVNAPAPVTGQVIALLKFDSLTQSPAFGLRGAATSERQILFSAASNELHLQVKQVEERWVIKGQVLGQCSGGEIELIGETLSVKALLNELCEFMLDSVPDGKYVLVARLPEAELKIPELKLGL
ncbi:MAG TPA: hypothetical protein VF747_07850 [Blastocatellia bacterium]|jgi:anti-sigma factor RsiW